MAIQPGNHILYLLVELFVCSIHPIPGDFSFSWKLYHFYTMAPTTSEYPVDAILSLPMFLRVYLVWRVFMLNEHLFSPLLKSLGKLNSVEINTSFLFKSLVEYYPLQILFAFNTILFLSASYCIKLTEGSIKAFILNWFNCENLNPILS